MNAGFDRRIAPSAVMALATAVAVCAIAAIAIAALQRDTLAAARPSALPLGSAALCQRYAGLPAPAPGAADATQAGMVRLPGGSFEPGSTAGYPDEQPAGRVRIAPFWIDRTEVTNAQFTQFVAATGYITQAEREGASAVFRAPGDQPGAPADNWWVWTRGADWRHPEGPGSDLQGREHLPVIHVTVNDALAYARWLGHDLPTEAEWEYAARANGEPERIERQPRAADSQPTANYWQGLFPMLNTREDGYAALAPVGCFAANGFGLYDVIGNVWELTRDRYSGARQPHANGDPGEAARAADRASGAPEAPRAGERMVIKGGSFLCAANYCMRYRSTAREAQDADLGASHVGFRTVMREPETPRPTP